MSSQFPKVGELWKFTKTSQRIVLVLKVEGSIITYRRMSGGKYLGGFDERPTDTTMVRFLYNAEKVS